MNWQVVRFNKATGGGVVIAGPFERKTDAEENALSQDQRYKLQQEEIRVERIEDQPDEDAQ